MTFSVKQNVCDAIRKTYLLYEKKPALFKIGDTCLEVNKNGEMIMGLISHIMINMGFVLDKTEDNVTIFHHPTYKLMTRYKPSDMFSIFAMSGVLDEIMQVEKIYNKNPQKGMKLLFSIIGDH